MRTRLDQQKKQHRERAQPLNRQRLGILEKHKDYVKRAKDYHSKEDRIKKLREKAAARNKDEFYFGMVRSRTEGGVHIQDRGNEPMPVDVVKLLKTQDAGYVRTLVSTEEKIIERLKRDLGSTVGLQEDGDQAGGAMLSDEDEENDLGEGTSTSKASILNVLSSGAGATQGKKTLFVDSAKQVAKFNPKKLLKGKGRALPSEESTSSATSAQSTAERNAHLSSLSTELSARLERLSLLQRTYREMQVQRLIMGKGSKQVVGGRKGGLSAEEQRLNEDDLDELELKRIKSGILGRKKLPEPEKGVRTGARVWKWKSERRR